MNHATTIAKAFSAKLRWNLTGEQMYEIVTKNASEEYKHCCATHDYCDANMLMLEAFEETNSRLFNYNSRSDAALWNEAWTTARQNNFKFD